MKFKEFTKWPEWTILPAVILGLSLCALIVSLFFRSITWITEGFLWNDMDTRFMIVITTWILVPAFLFIFGIKEKGETDGE